MGYLSFKSLSLASTLFIFAGCAIVDKTVDTAMTPVDSVGHTIDTSYENTSSYLSKLKNKTSGYFSDLSNSTKDNSVGKLFFDDKDIQQGRENLIKWQYSNKRYKDKGKEISSSEKFDTFFKDLSIAAQDNYLAQFNKKTPKPKFNEFLSDRENINIFNEYNLNLLKVKNQWNETLDQRRKEILSDTFNAVYGNPVVDFVSYDVYSEKVFLNIRSLTDETFKFVISFDADKQKAQKIKNNTANLTPVVYFKEDDDHVNLEGITLFMNRSKKEFYLVDMEEEAYKRENRFFTVHGDGKMESTYADINLQQQMKTLKNKPDWYDKRISPDYYYGFGYGMSKNEAILVAKKEIADQKGVTILSVNNERNQQLNGDNYKKTYSSKIKETLNDVMLAGLEKHKEDLVEGVYYYSYKLKK